MGARVLLDIAASKNLLFVGGKGGVGKTSIASTIALARADAGARVLVVSTDPAHSLGHLWDMKIGDRITELGPTGLYGLEINPASATDQHLAEVGERLNRLVPAHMRPEVRKHLRLAKEAPGTHEAAMLERIATTIEVTAPEFDLVVFDTAPSGHTARLMELPETMAMWTQGMLHRHDRAQKFTDALKALDDDDPALDVVAVGRGQSKAERDSEIRRILLARQKRFTNLRGALQDPDNTAFIVVFQGERLPALETVELVHQLHAYGMEAAAGVINRRSPKDAGELLAKRHAQEDEHIGYVREHLPTLPLVEVPLLGEDLRAPETLRQIAPYLT